MDFRTAAHKYWIYYLWAFSSKRNITQKKRQKSNDFFYYFHLFSSRIMKQDHYITHCWVTQTPLCDVAIANSTRYVAAPPKPVIFSDLLQWMERHIDIPPKRIFKSYSLYTISLKMRTIIVHSKFDLTVKWNIVKNSQNTMYLPQFFPPNLRCDCEALRYFRQSLFYTAQKHGD